MIVRAGIPRQCAHNGVVAGSNPTGPTIKSLVSLGFSESDALSPLRTHVNNLSFDPSLRDNAPNSLNIQSLLFGRWLNTLKKSKS